MYLSYLNTTKGSGSVSLKYQAFTLESSFYSNDMFPECLTECITDQFINALK